MKLSQGAGDAAVGDEAVFSQSIQGLGRAKTEVDNKRLSEENVCLV
jgi:hypothetical protein